MSSILPKKEHNKHKRRHRGHRNSKHNKSNREKKRSNNISSKYTKSKGKKAEITNIDVNMTLNKKELILFGFIRSIESTLNKHIIIPMCIVKICYTFYFSPFNIFTFNQSLQKLSILNITNNKISHLISMTNQHKEKITNPMCYIPNISSIISINTDNKSNLNINKCYDGVIYIFHDYIYQKEKFAAILLFASNEIENKDIAHYQFKSTNPLPSSNQNRFYHNTHRTNTNDIRELIYCGPKHGIIYHSLWDNNLYQLQLNNLDIISNNYFNFKMIKKSVIPQINNLNSSMTMSYLDNTEKLFAIECNVRGGSYIKKATCYLYDFNVSSQWKSKWQQIKSYDYVPLGSNTRLQFGISKNNLNELNRYIVSNTGRTAKYDMIKNKWITLLFDDKTINFSSEPIVWFNHNPNILHCAHKQYFANLDVRTKQKKWVNIATDNSAFHFISDDSYHFL